MKALNTYLNFDGNAREAMEFYKICLGAKLDIMTFGDSPMQAPPGSEKRVMHARLTKGPLSLMASDTMPGMPFQHGNNFSLAIDLGKRPAHRGHTTGAGPFRKLSLIIQPVTA